MAKLRKNKRFLEILTIIFSILFSFFILEIGLRIYFRDDHSHPNHRTFFSKKKIWDEKYANLNSQGYRDHEFTEAKPPNTFRILVLGDSLTWGSGVKKINDLYTEILEDKLNQKPYKCHFEVLNLAKRGRNVKYYLNTLVSPGFSYNPDLVMIGFYINDIEAHKKDRPKDVKILPSKAHHYFAKSSFAYWYAYWGLNCLINKEKWIGYHLSYTNPNSFHWKRFSALWEDLLLKCKTRKIKTVILIFPYMRFLSDAHPFTTVYRSVTALSEKNGTVVLNLFPLFKGQNPRDMWVGITDPHPNETAHRIYADAIYKFFEKREDLINEPPRS
jgi:hypothetical protein